MISWKNKIGKVIEYLILFLGVCLLELGDAQRTEKLYAGQPWCMGFCVTPYGTRWQCLEEYVPHCFLCHFPQPCP